MASFITIQAFLILALFLLMVFYAWNIVKLIKRLETCHHDDLIKLNFGKKLKGIWYRSTPKQAKNVLKFIFGGNFLDDLKVRRLQSRLKNIILLSVLFLILFIISLLIESPNKTIC